MHTAVLCDADNVWLLRRCVYQHPDSTGKIGVELSRDLVKVAGKALTHNLTKLGPKVLPWSEKLLYAGNWVARKVAPGRWQEYVPDFKQAFDHFCLHAGTPHRCFCVLDKRFCCLCPFIRGVTQHSTT